MYWTFKPLQFGITQLIKGQITRSPFRHFALTKGSKEQLITVKMGQLSTHLEPNFRVSRGTAVSLENTFSKSLQSLFSLGCEKFFTNDNRLVK